MGFRYSRRVQFADTDLVGIVHFSMFFRYMEEAGTRPVAVSGASRGAGG